MTRLGMSLAGSYLGYQLQNLFLLGDEGGQRKKRVMQKSAAKMRQELEALKGPLMKFGQALSMQSHLVPEEFLQELSSLQMRAPAMHPSLMRIQFKNSLGTYPEEIFGSFEEEPFAAASLGQVHRAVTKKGQPIAVKIQYPNIRKAVTSDLNLMKTLLLPARTTRHVSAAFIKELEGRILEEIDYQHEAENIAFFQKAMKLPYVELPRVYPAYSSGQVLTMSFVEGEHFTEWLKTKPSQELRDLVGGRLFELFYYQVCRMDSLHADPHLGNYLFRHDGSLGLVDFGCVKYFDAQFLDLVRKTYFPEAEAAESKFKALYEHQGIPYSEKAREIFRELNKLYRIVYPTKAEEQKRLTDFGDPWFLKELTRLSQKILSNRLILPELFFYIRAEGGLYNTLHQLKARVPASDIVRRCLLN